MWAISATVIVGNAYERVDSALLAPLAGTASVGIYRMIAPIVGAALMPARAFGDAAAVGAGRTERTSLRRFVTKFALKGAMITVPVAVVLAIVGPVVLPKLLQSHGPHAIVSRTWSMDEGSRRLSGAISRNTSILTASRTWLPRGVICPVC